MDTGVEKVDFYICADGTVVIQFPSNLGYTITRIERLCNPMQAYLDAGIVNASRQKK